MANSKQLEDAVFYTALTVTDPELRRTFLDQACGGNPMLRANVEEMLAAGDEAEQFFEKGKTAITDSLLEPGLATPDEDKPSQKPATPLADEQIGSHIGRYKLLQRLGEGGCGVVYLAEQKEPVHRQVAVKVIKLGMDTKNVIARFEAERQALALMEHPNIARVLDAGATETGRPYFVMELVGGVRITSYCDQHHLDTQRRLELFIQICQAIQHAHQKGIIHRDIKPSNILVTIRDGVPVPKVIDFGIAKAIEGRLIDDTLFTPCEQFVGTPAYMSPEQAEMHGLDVDTRSDIYSLGVLLYELLTGRTPFDPKKLMESGLDELRRTLREKEPQRPSEILATLQRPELNVVAAQRQVDGAHLISLLGGDLDWIVMKTLEKERIRRYETVNGLAMDIQRYLNNEPVTARPPSRLYRFQKLVHRNKVVFASGAMVVLTLIAGLGASTWMFFREKEAKYEQAQLREIAEKAGRRESELRQQAEANSRINQAAIYVSQGRLAEADRLLSEFKTLPPRPSYDGVNAFRSVGEWLALQGRWRDAADDFFPLLEIDKLDGWQVVTLDYQACGALLAESNDRERYAKFCDLAIATYGTTTNGDMAGRILKSCLLFPPDKELMARLQPMADAVDKTFGSVPPGAHWALVHLSLWNYRHGDFNKAEFWCDQVSDADLGTGIEATTRIVRAMIRFQQHRISEAQTDLAAARSLIERKDHVGKGDTSGGLWYDWLFARVLLREANGMMNHAESSSK